MNSLFEDWAPSIDDDDDDVGYNNNKNDVVVPIYIAPTTTRFAPSSMPQLAHRAFAPPPPPQQQHFQMPAAQAQAQAHAFGAATAAKNVFSSFSGGGDGEAVPLPAIYTGGELLWCSGSRICVG